MPAAERRPWLQRPALAKLVAAHAPAALLALAVIVVAFSRWRSGQAPGFGIQDLIGIGMGNYQINFPRPNLLSELAVQLSWPVVVIGLLGIIASALTGDWRQRWLIMVGAVPMLAIGLLASFWYPRYLLFTLPPLIVVAVCGWDIALRASRFRLALRTGVLLICVGFMAWQSAHIILAPLEASWSPVDRYQYFEGPGSGYGYPQAARFILAVPNAPRMIYSLDGHSAYQLQAYLPPQWRARVAPVFFAADGRMLRAGPERLQNLLTSTPAWLISPEPLLSRYLLTSFGEGSAGSIKVRELAAFDKPGFLTRLAIYEVTPRRPAATPEAMMNR
jgi:hypothetical protein